MAWRPRGNKFGVATKEDRTYKGIVFDSKKEMLRYQELELMERAGAISGLQRQPPFELHVKGIKIGTYKADFLYVDNADGCSVVEDVKGGSATKTPLYKWKKKHVEAEYGVFINEV